MASDQQVQRGRRRFLQRSLALTSLGLVVGCGQASLPWQQTTKIPRIGYLALSNTAAVETRAFHDGLRELGYLEGQTITVEERWAGANDQLSALAAELAGLPVDLIVAAAGPSSIEAAMRATRTIPIVFPVAGNPVQSGFVSSLDRPGGNVTGLSTLGAQTEGKRLQLLSEIMPRVSRILYLTDTAAAAVGVREARQSAQALGLQILTPDIASATDLAAALELAVVTQAEALLVTGVPLMLAERARIVEFATATRLPLIAQERSFAADGGLASYGPARSAMYGRAAVYVDKILRGTKPGDLPVEQPTKFDFVVNLKTAQALGITIPQSVLQQATEVIR